MGKTIISSINFFVGRQRFERHNQKTFVTFGSFQKLVNVLKLTYGAVRRNQATANTTNSEIDNAIRNWLKNAPDRAGGRANRKNKK
ncbi:hypothetical protein JTB14_036679 [Gonioctena quinquepunctata]|nr:hypothetical protein JTB14_036679 [Gonioctena quinquepunctata]